MAEVASIERKSPKLNRIVAGFIIQTKMIEIINTVISGIERLLVVVNSGRRLLFLSCLTLLVICSFLVYQLARSQDVIAEFTAPRIERVSGWCYQQRVRRDRRIAAIQFPIPQYLIEAGVTQNVVAFVFEKQVNQSEFDKLCSGLIDEVFDPQSKIKLLQSNPQWKKKLQDFYINLDNPIVQQPPLTKTEATK